MANQRLGDVGRRAVGRRAVEAAIWGMPAVNYQLMYQEMVLRVGGNFNEIVYWSRLLDWRNQTLTPNPDVIYLRPFFNTRAVGPVVLEIPPADDGVINGSVMNYWQTAIEDVGPGGVDKGQGGKYVILPPDHNAAVPPGYIAMPSDTYAGYALLRSILRSGCDADVAQAVSYAKRIKMYALADAADPPPSRFIDASDVVFDSTIPYDLRFFEALNDRVQAEPWLERDKAMIDPLKTLGIERGKTFDPNSEMQQLLCDGIVETRAYLDELYSDQSPYYDGAHWFFPVTEEMHQNVMSFWHTPDSFPLDARAVAYSIAFFSAKHLGESQYYLLSTRDADGEALDGGASYRLRALGL